MPADDGLGANDYEMILPARPQARKGDPERTVQRAQSWSRPTLRVHRKLLTQGKLDDCLFLTAPEERGDAVKKQHYEMDQSAHGERDSAQYFGLERV
jgi:hypothetical protein